MAEIISALLMIMANTGVGGTSSRLARAADLPVSEGSKSLSLRALSCSQGQTLTSSSVTSDPAPILLHRPSP